MNYYNDEADSTFYNKYIHISSRHIDFASSKSDFQVNLIQPIKNVSEVALKCFSMPNTQYNIGHNQRLQWFESYDIGTTIYYQGFEILLTGGYYTASELATHINSRIALLPTRIVHGGSQASLQFSYDASTFKFSITYTPVTGENKRFAIFFATDEHIYHSLGFEKIEGIEEKHTRDITVDWTDQLVESLAPYSSLETRPFFNGTQIAQNVAIIDNMKGLFINCPDLSISSSYETHIRHSTNQAQQTHILEWIPNNVSRLVYLHYEPQHLSWHKLDNTDNTLNQFKIEILNYHGKKISVDEIQDFSMVLIVKCKEVNEKSLETRERQYSAAYAKAHPTTRLS